LALGDHDRFGLLGYGTEGQTTASSAHEALALLYGSPAGISFWQVASALLYWEEFVSIGVVVLNSTRLFWKVGSGKLGTPCERMHAAALR